MNVFLIFVIQILIQTLRVLSWVIIINALLSFFMSPLHPIRQTLDRFLEPLLRPIRERVPPMGMFDMSPLVLLLLLWIVQQVLQTIAFSL